MKDALTKLLKMKSIVTIALTVCMVLMVTGVFNPPTAILDLYKMVYVAVITYFFTKKDKEDQ